MKNKAKCKLCHSIIESFHASDYVYCECGEIALDGGEAMRCAAKNWDNLVRIDDEGKEHMVIVTGFSKYDLADMEPYPNDNPRTGDVKPLDIPQDSSTPSKVDLINMLDEMAKSIENLPQNAMTLPITQYDQWALITLISQILKAD